MRVGVTLGSRGRDASSRALEAALLPQFFPIPHPVRGLDGQWETELMRQHAYLPAMMRVVRNHICQHGRACGPWLGPSIAAKALNAVAGPRESFHKHLTASFGAFGEGNSSLLLRAAGAVERGRQLYMRSREP
jgi:hypothetical protein